MMQTTMAIERVDGHASDHGQESGVNISVTCFQVMVAQSTTNPH